MSRPLNKQQHNNSKRKRLSRTISVTGSLNESKTLTIKAEYTYLVFGLVSR